MKGLLSLIVFILIIEISFVSSLASIGISPASVKYENVLRGGYSEKYLTVLSDSVEKLNFELEPYGEIKDWIELSEYNISVSNGNPGRVLVSITPPEDTANGNYRGLVRVKLKDVEEIEETNLGSVAASVVRGELDFVIDVNVIDVEYRNCRALGYKVDSVEKGDDIILKMNFENNGNVRIRPKMEVKIWDKDQITVVKSDEGYGDIILPTRTGEVEIRVKSSDMDEGQYWVEMSSSECLSSEIATFDVLAPGTLRSDGKIIAILSRKNASVGDTILLNVIFKNTGQKGYDAKFRGQISLDGKVVKLLDSEDQFVSVGETTNFSFYYSPERKGKHIINGRVYYNNKKTFEETAILDVFGAASRINYLLYGLVIGLIILLFYIYYSVRRERRRYSDLISIKIRFK